MKEMKKWFPFLFIIFTFLLVASNAYAEIGSSIVGNWLTIDDITNKPRSIIQIWDAGNGTYQGKLIKVFYRPGEGVNDLCVKCTDIAHKNKKILGMTILWGLKQTGPNAWGDGLILDPDTGNIYHAKATLDYSGNKLSARGYIGFSLFGRTQVWERVDSKGNLIS